MNKLSIFAFALGASVSPGMAGPLHNAVIDGDVAEVRRLIATGEDVNAEDSVLGTPLAIAALKGNDAVAAVLIANGADPKAARSRDGRTPLHEAAERGHPAMVELLVEAGADVNARTNEDLDYAPIHAAGLVGHFDVVELLRALGATGPRIEPFADLLNSADAALGAVVYNDYCHGCHTIEKGAAPRPDPNLWGVLGRDKANTEGFGYSEAFQRLVGTWTLAEFNAYIASPVDYVPGTKMRFKGLDDPVQRADLIAFLRQNSDDPPPLPPRP